MANIIEEAGRLVIADTIQINGWTFSKEEILERQKLRLQCVELYYKGHPWYKSDDLSTFFLGLMGCGEDPRDKMLNRLAVISAGAVECLPGKPLTCTNGWFQTEVRNGKLAFRLDVVKEATIGMYMHSYYYEADTMDLLDEAEIWDLKDGRHIQRDREAIVKAAHPNICDGKASDVLVYDGEIFTKETLIAERIHQIDEYNDLGDDDVIDRAESMRLEFLLAKDCTKWNKLVMLSFGGVEIQYHHDIENTPDWDRWFKIETGEDGRPMFRFDMDIKERGSGKFYYARTVETYFFDCETLELVKAQATTYKKDGTVEVEDIDI